MLVLIFNTVHSQIDISGNIRTEENENMLNVTVNLTGPGVSLNVQSDINGNYLFSNVPANEPYTICLDHDIYPLNGVSTFDPVLIARHIIAIQPFNTPYKIIGADVSGNGIVSILDLILIRRLILNIDSDFANVPSWRFVPADHVFDPVNPFPLPLPLQCKNLPTGNTHLSGVDFIGIKSGDADITALVGE